MPGFLKGFLTVVVSAALTATVFVILALVVNGRGAAGGMALAGKRASCSHTTWTRPRVG